MDEELKSYGTVFKRKYDNCIGNQEEPIAPNKLMIIFTFIRLDYSFKKNEDKI